MWATSPPTYPTYNERVYLITEFELTRSMANKIFISYAHANDEHVENVAGLVAALRKSGLEVSWDRDITTPHGPSKGWEVWMPNQISAATWVLVVCEAVYYRRFWGTEPEGIGRGVGWEAAIIRARLYATGLTNDKYIPVVFGDTPASMIPEPLSGATCYCLPRELLKLITALGGSRPVNAPSQEPPQQPAKPAPPLARRKNPGELPAGVLALLLLGFTVAALMHESGNTASTAVRPSSPHVQAGTLPQPLRVRAQVITEHGKPLSLAIVRLAGVTVMTDGNGWFVLDIPADRLDEVLTIEIEKSGYQTWRNLFVPGGSAPEPVLFREAPADAEQPSS